jgi:hypothetical protein
LKRGANQQACTVAKLKGAAIWRRLLNVRSFVANGEQWIYPIRAA